MAEPTTTVQMGYESAQPIRMQRAGSISCETLGVCRAAGETCPAGECRYQQLYQFAPGVIEYYPRRGWLTADRANAIGNAVLYLAVVFVIVGVCGFSSGYFGRVWGLW